MVVQDERRLKFLQERSFHEGIKQKECMPYVGHMLI